ncbi:hypothetical protein RJ639_004719 [Escallonia herrerae]|uniref:Protein kinase domain-containing protein n=1 Tax=Escallonia herrerae TaxID=1293975 RepID=A0AA89AXH4_9ASTE|nr:hypothetical protein RJ639_004719 [Escallonia herrerae]
MDKHLEKEEVTRVVMIHLSIDASTKLVVGVVVPGVFLIVLIGMALYRFVISKKRKKDDQAKIERFLEDYEAQKPTRFSYADIKRFTNQFRDQLGQGSYGTVFKGKLSDDILIAVEVLNNDSKGGEEFINEVGIIGTIHHVNVVHLVGYCADGFRRALVYEFLPNNSLENFGMLLLEMVGARENIDTGIQNTTQPYFPQWIYDRLGQGREVGIQIDGEGSDKIAKKLTTMGLWCIRWHPVDRPSIKAVIQMLEGQEIPSMPPNPFGPTNAITASAERPRRTFSNKLEIHWNKVAINPHDRLIVNFSVIIDISVINALFIAVINPIFPSTRA